MDLRDVDDATDAGKVETLDRHELERNIKQVEDARPGTFRYSDTRHGGEVRTSTDNPQGAQSLAKAELFRRDGSSDILGTARYSVAGGEARLYGGSVIAQDYGTEEALLSEVGDQARVQGVDRLSVFVPDGDQTAMQRWGRHGFYPAQASDPGARGITLEKLL